MLLLGLVGLALVLVRGSILQPLQRRAAVLRCARCAGWWVGLIGGAIADSFQVLPAHVGTWLLSAGAVSVLATAADLLFAWIDSHTKD